MNDPIDNFQSLEIVSGDIGIIEETRKKLSRKSEYRQFSIALKTLVEDYLEIRNMYKDLMIKYKKLEEER